jgi:hypothetical protein
MLLQIVISLFGQAETFLPYIVNTLVAVWFLSVGYLLWKRISRRERVPDTVDAPATAAVFQS